MRLVYHTCDIDCDIGGTQFAHHIRLCVFAALFFIEWNVVSSLSALFY